MFLDIKDNFYEARVKSDFKAPNLPLSLRLKDSFTMMQS
jgi:hypothetical protein